MIKHFDRRIFPVCFLACFLPAAARAETTPFVKQTGTWLCQTGYAGWAGAAAALLVFVLACFLILLLRQQSRIRKMKAEINRQRKTADKAFRQQQSMEDILNHLNDYVFFHDLSGNFYEFNSAVRRDSDYSATELKQMNLRNLVRDPYIPQVDDYLQRLQKNGKDHGYMRLVNKDGKDLILEYTSTLIHKRGGEVAGVRGIARNITEQHKTRKALKKSEKKYRTILNTIEDGYYEVDLAGHYRLLNRAVLRMHNYTWEELKGQSYKKLIDEEDVQSVFETFNYVYRTGNPVKAFNWKTRRKDGSILHLEASVSLLYDNKGKPAGFRGITRDISERIQARKKTRQLEARLQQAQKMESIGTLAGGIAHDFNNVLFPIIGYTELALQDIPSQTSAAANLEKVLQAADRAKGLVRQILAFSRQSAEQDPEPVRVEPIIKETLKLLRNTIPASIEIHSDIQQDAGAVTIHPAQLHQVIMNLCTNAYHAMENQPTGKLEVNLRRVRVTAENTGLHAQLDAGTYICITVSDTGCGMSAEVMEKIFDPYFTTKSQDKGTGLGLSVSYGIAQNAGGIIITNSTPEKGSRFHVYLPAAKSSQDRQSDPKPDTCLPEGSERILLVDDEKRVLEVEQMTLQKLGYQVTAFSDSPEAFNAFKSKPDHFDLVITDQSMPQISGIELARKIRQIRSHVPVILCSGYSEKITRETILEDDIQAILLKPISRQEMAGVIRKTLDSMGQIPVKEQK
ncbi:MAG: PAS domain S-box protein [Desulfosalsimonas sp.]|uniref:hybrid sensor histidine kinase/response regulator n=1 Tax=Desulfosalsimonas sp. TaxID=3073848 RepID=UPI003970BEFD